MIINKTHFPNEIEILESINSEDHIKKVQVIGQNDLYLWSLGWLNELRPSIDRTPDLKISIIFPATKIHIQKYSKQTSKIIRETPQLYNRVVVPYIEKLPASRLSWIYNILDHVTEADQIVYEDKSETDGFIIIPDFKWDRTTLASLYLLCIVNDRQIRCLRDIRPRHLSMLNSIRQRAFESIERKYNVPPRELRMFVHYQPSYYHFHIHITHVDYLGFQGITVGQAHLLDDIIGNLEFELAHQSLVDRPSSYYESKILVYALGSNHDMFKDLWSQQQLEESNVELD